METTTLLKLEDSQSTQQLTALQIGHNDFLKKEHDLTTLGKIEFLKTEKVRISNIKKENPQQSDMLLGMNLAKCCALSGCKEQPDIDMVKEIKDLVYTDFKHLSLSEIYYAFKNEFSGRYLKKETDTRTNHFNLFSVQYVSDILRKFVIWKKEEIKQNNILKTDVKLLKVDVSDIEKERILKEGVERMKKEYQETGTLLTTNAHIYDYLYEKGVLPTDLEYKKKIFKKAKHIEITELKKNKYKKKKSVKLEIANVLKSKSDYTKSLCKKLVLLDFLEDRIK